MKRLLIFFMTLMLSLCLFAGCSSTSNPSGSNADSEQNIDEPRPPEDDKVGSDENQKEITTMYITVNGNKLEVSLARNSSVEALIELLKQGDIAYTAHANNFEIYGDIGHDLTTKNDTHLTSQVGDVFLWAGDNICIFFGNNSYSYTRIGKIEGYTAAQLKEMLAPTSSVQVTISLK